MTGVESAVNVAVVLPGATVTDEGTASMVLSLESDTTVPNLEADRDKLTVHVVVDPEAKVVASQPRPLTVRGVEPMSKPLGISMEEIRV